MTVGETRFSNSKAIVTDFLMVPRQKQFIPLLDAGIYNSILNKSEDEFLPLQERGLKNLYKRFSDFLKSTFNTDVIEVPPLIDTKDKNDFNYYSTPSETVKSKIIKICTKNDAEYFIGVTGQLRTLAVSAFGINGSNDLIFSITIFDSIGNIVANGTSKTPAMTISASDNYKFASLFDIAGDYIETLIKRMIL